MINVAYGSVRVGSLSIALLKKVELPSIILQRSFKTALKNKEIKKVSRLKFASKLIGTTLLVLPPSVFASWYYFASSERQQNCLADARSQLPSVLKNAGAKRFIRSLWTGLVASIDYKYSLYGLDDDSDEYRDALSQVHLRSASHILDCCLANSGLYIKLGQGLSTMNHVLPKEYTDTLKVLLDKCLRRQSSDEIENIFIRDLGKPPSEIFKSFDPKPIAAASLAEVFKATTLDDKQVAVKVQYSDLRERFESDIATCATILDFIELMHPRFSFRWLLDELKETMFMELDFEAEGKNSEKCKKDLQHFNYIYVPDVLWSITSKRILTTEFIDGVKISETEKLKEEGLNLSEIGESLLHAFGEQVFHTGFVHADPHPGNILVRKHNGTKHAELILLDHGLYETIPTEIRLPLARVWQAVVENDHIAMKKYSNELGVEDYRLFCIALTTRWIGTAPGERDFLTDYIESRGGIKNLSRKHFKTLPEEQKVKIRAAFRDIHDKMFDVFQNIPPRLVLVFRNLNIIRSIIKDHDSGVDRHQIMARSAVRGFFVKKDDPILRQFWGLFHLLIFDLRLLIDLTKLRIMSIFTKLLKFVGYIPSLEHLQEDFTKDNEKL